MSEPLSLVDRSPLAAARLCAEAPSDAIHASAGYRDLTSANRARVDGLLAGAGDDPDFGCRLMGLLRGGFADCDETHQAIILDALAREPDAKNLGRLEILAGDPELQRMMPRDAARQADDVVDGAAFPAIEGLARRSGADAHRTESFSRFGAIELSTHAVEMGYDLVLEHFAVGVVGASGAATVLAGLVPGAMCLVSMAAGLRELGEAHRAGQEWGANVARGQGFVAQLGHHLRGDDAVMGRGPRSEGAAAADRFWQDLAPSQRVELRTLEHQDAALSALSASVERLTIAGR